MAARTVNPDAVGMSAKYLKQLFALLALGCLMMTTPVLADSFDFTVQSLQAEDSGGC